MVGLGLKKIRKANKMTQDQLAKKLGVSRQAICMWESNKRELKARVLNKIAKIFSVTVDQILQLERKAIRENIMKQRGRRIRFELLAPQANEVKLAGDFNAWQREGIHLKKNRLGRWNIGINLKPGRYEYKFIVDNEWWTDPHNEKTVYNNFGNLNSVKEVEI